MDASNIRLSRISKLLVDGNAMSAQEALARRARNAITLKCGSDVGKSRTLQLAVLTAANIANRCFPGAVRVVLERDLADAAFLIWPSIETSFGAALTECLGGAGLGDASNSAYERRVLLFGDAAPVRGALRVTFDGWVAKVGPATNVDPLPERQYCALSGVLAGALAISEMFLSFAEVTVAAGRRTVGLSLWRPDLPISDPSALGVQVEVLPRDLWVLGLGHLGNAYLWALAALPYAQPDATEIFLNDFDKVENVETGVIFNIADERRFKTRACSRWLEDRGFRTRLIERPFDSHFRCRTVQPQVEPQLALCGFDSNPARRDLQTAGFTRVVESGLGGTKDNFDTISFHTLPNPRPPQELWPDRTPEEEARHRENQQRLATENPAYSELGSDECGRAELAGKSVAVPFVGVTAATLVLAEAIRLLHDGPAYTDLKLVLSDLTRRYAETNGNYSPQDSAGIDYCDSDVRH
jgi:hypothetical protein